MTSVAQGYRACPCWCIGEADANPFATKHGNPAMSTSLTRSYGMLARLASGRCLSGELIAERHHAARREDAAEDSAAHAS